MTNDDQLIFPILWSQLKWPPARRIVVLAPHPDDFDTVAVTLRRFDDAGHAVFLLVLLPGHGGVENTFPNATSLKAKSAIREAEQRASCRLFGLPESRLFFLDNPENKAGDPIESSPGNDQIHRRLRHLAPDIIILPHGNDTNAGHRWGYALFRAFAESAAHPVTGLLFHDPKTIQMTQHLLVPFDGETAQWKRTLLCCHETQQQRNLANRGYGFDERILRDNRESAGHPLVSAPFAETFEIAYWENHEQCPWPSREKDL